MNDPVQQLRSQVEDLQSQVAFQEDAMNALNDAIAGQQQEILMLRRQLELLAERLKEPDAPAIGAEPPPPHY